MLRRNRFGFRMRRRSLTNRLLQFIVVAASFFLFVYFLIYAMNLQSNATPPDYSWLKTRNLSHFIRPEESSLLIRPKCDKETLRLITLVVSSPENFKRRKVIRKTWGKDLKRFPGTKIFFFLGRSSKSDASIQAEIEAESDENADIVQEDFTDVYVNLTLKTTFMLKWVNASECGKPKFVFKVDDDTFVNPKVLWNALEHALLHTTSVKSMRAYVGNFNVTSKTIGDGDSIDYLFMGRTITAVPIRDPGNKWYLPLKFYPLNIFPKYIAGHAYVFSTSVLPMLYSCALGTPFMNLEDVFISGLCATSQLGLVLTNREDFRPWKPILASDYECFYKTSATMHPVPSTEDMEEAYAKLADDHNCDTFYFSFVRGANHVVTFLKNIFRL